MKVRMIKRRHDRRTTFKALLWAGMNDEMRWHTLEYDGDDPWDDDMPDDVRLHCHGDGMDPDRDYLLQCPDCGGSW